jgi:hypothetical protein
MAHLPGDTDSDPVQDPVPPAPPALAREAHLVAALLALEEPELARRYAAGHGTELDLERDIEHLLHLLVTGAPAWQLLDACELALRRGLPRRTLRQALRFAEVVLPESGRLDEATSRRVVAETDRLVRDELLAGRESLRAAS